MMSNCEYAVLKNIPEIIETERLYLRVIRPGDGPMIFKAVEETRTQLESLFCWARQSTKPDDLEKFARESHIKFLKREDFVFLVFLKNTTQTPHDHYDKFVGCCHLGDVNWDLKSAFIGYWIRKSAQGNGIAQEFVKALTYFGIQDLGLIRLSLYIHDINHASYNVAEKCGFSMELRTRGIGCLLPTDTEPPLVRLYSRHDLQGLEGFSYQSEHQF
jgi:RimJ/RimL family protein N-acetyltransferase